MKILRTLGLVLVIVVIALAVFKDAVIQTSVTTIGSAVVGAPIKLGGFSSSLIRQKVRIKDLKLYNPPGFPDEPLIDITEIGVDYDLPALLNGKLHLPLVIVDVKEMVVVKNKDGQLNVDSLKVAQAADKKEEPKKEEKGKKESKMMPMQIDELRLNVGRVVVKDYTKGGEPKVEAFGVGMRDRVFKNITSPEQLATLILVNAMGPAAIQGAKIYGATAILGAAFLPAGVATALTGKDDVQADLPQPFDKVYDAALEVVTANGSLKSESRPDGIIKAKMDGADVAVRVEKSDSGAHITISARKMLLPKPEVAGGVLYKLQEKLK